MSLQVWLPLTKDLRQQGLSNVGVINNGATYSSTGGKLGGCYSFDGTDDNFSYIPNVDELETFSVAVWICPAAATPKGVIFGLERGTYWQFELYQNTIGIRDNSIGWNGTRKNFSTGTYMANGWTHLVVTYNNGELKVYRDGTLNNTYTVGGSKLNTGIDGARIGSAVQAGYYHAGKINDFRFYDHCLSPMEVKQISQGLILHYPLNRNGWGQENLVNNSDFSNLTTTGAVIRDDTVLFHGHSTCKISRTGATSNTYTGWSSQNLFPRLTPGAKVTVSVWMYRESTHGIDAGCEWRMYQRYNNDTSTDWTGFFSSANWPVGEWKKFTHTYTVRSDVSSAYLSFDVVKNGTYWFAEPKVEIGEIATSWAPSSTDTLTTTMSLNSTTEYDCSGFCNNGKYYAYDANGSITYTSDTPKYSISTHIASANPTQNAASGTRYLYGHCELTNPTQMSVAFWLKPITGGYGGTTSNGQGYFCTTNYEYGSSSVGSDYQSSAMNHRDGAVNMNDSTSTTQCNVTFYPIIGEWHHYVYTYDGQVGKGYKDGVQTATAQFNAAKTLDSFIGIVIGFSKAGGVWRRNDACYSDFRIYATALSADDVRALYENSAYIDNSGNIYAATYTEV